jgi:hypothetical protein
VTKNDVAVFQLIREVSQRQAVWGQPPQGFRGTASEKSVDYNLCNETVSEKPAIAIRVRQNFYVLIFEFVHFGIPGNDSYEFTKQIPMSWFRVFG